MLLCDNSLTSIDITPLSLCTWVLKEKWATLTILMFNCIQSYSIFNWINTFGFSIRVLFTWVLMFLQHILSLNNLSKVVCNEPLSCNVGIRVGYKFFGNIYWAGVVQNADLGYGMTTPPSSRRTWPLFVLHQPVQYVIFQTLLLLLFVV